MKELEINGEILKSMGITDGKTIGLALKAALDETHRDNSLNTRAYLIDFIGKGFLNN